MSNLGGASLVCTRCGMEFEKKVPTSVNSRHDPDLIRHVFAQTFFNHECPRCKFTFEGWYNTLYHDQDQKFMVWLVCPTFDGNIEVPSGIKLLSSDVILDNYRLHISRSPFHWVERISTLQCRIDPRMIELYKFGYKVQHNMPLETPNDFLHFRKYTQYFKSWGRTRFHWNVVQNDGVLKDISRLVNGPMYASYEVLLNSIGETLWPSQWYMIDWQFPFAIPVEENQKIVIPSKSNFIEIGDRKSIKLPDQFLDVTKRTGKSQDVFQ